MGKINQFTFLFIVLGMFSCVSPKKIIYFQGDVGKDSLLTFSPKYSPNDLLGITVHGSDMELLKPFNPQLDKGNVGGSYLVDEQGIINFPIIGEVKIAGFTRTEGIGIFKEKLKEYITNPVVDIRLLNFKITILGSVNNPGTYPITGERITLIEAIGLAGDLQITGVRENILVIRNINGQRHEFRVDLTSKDVFTSPAYYLVPNDIIYVQPNKGGVNASAQINTMFYRTNIGMIASLFSTVVTLFILFRINK